MCEILQRVSMHALGFRYCFLRLSPHYWVPTVDLLDTCDVSEASLCVCLQPPRLMGAKERSSYTYYFLPVPNH